MIVRGHGVWTSRFLYLVLPLPALPLCFRLFVLFLLQNINIFSHFSRFPPTWEYRFLPLIFPPAVDFTPAPFSPGFQRPSCPLLIMADHTHLSTTINAIWTWLEVIRVFIVSRVIQLTISDWRGSNAYDIITDTVSFHEALRSAEVICNGVDSSYHVVNQFFAIERESGSEVQLTTWICERVRLLKISTELNLHPLNEYFKGATSRMAHLENLSHLFPTVVRNPS